MVTLERYEKLLDMGIGLDHYYLLICLYNGEKIPTIRKIQGFAKLLEMRGYIKDNMLTEAGIDLVQEDYPPVTTSTTHTTTLTPEQPKDFNSWVQQLHINCQLKLSELTGSKQVRDKINGKAYSFLPNAIDLSKVLYKVVKLYKLNDFGAIEKCIMNYMDKCHKAGNWFPILAYYIMKNNKSELVTDLENVETEEEQSNNNFSGEVMI